MLISQQVAKGFEQRDSDKMVLRLDGRAGHLRCRDARNTRYRAARYALPGRDLHPLDHASFPGAPCDDPHMG